MRRHDVPERTDAPFARANGASWCPLLSGAAQDRALEAVYRIAADITASRHEGGAQSDPSLSAGRAAHAVFFAQLARAGHGDNAAHHAERRLDEAVDTLASTPLGASLYSGFSGVAWAADLVG